MRKSSNSSTQTDASAFNTQVQNLNNITAYFIQREGTTLLHTALIQIEKGWELFTIRALLDAGAERSFITTSIQHRPSLLLEKHCSEISGFGGNVVGRSKGKCFVNIKSRISDFKIKISAIVANKIANVLPSQPIKIDNYKSIQSLKLVDPKFYKSAAIDIKIGTDVLPLINLEGIIFLKI